MASEYQHIADYDGVTRYADGATIPPDPANVDWAEYVAYSEAGGTTDPAPVPPAPGPPEPIELPADPVEDMDAATKGYVDDQVAGVTARLDALERRLG